MAENITPQVSKPEERPDKQDLYLDGSINRPGAKVKVYPETPKYKEPTK